MIAPANPVLRSRWNELLALCREYRVASLDLFGSAVEETWVPNESDLDFVVRFRDEPGRGLADRYLGLAQDLEKLFGTRVDLLTWDSIRNPYLQSSIEATRVPVYAE